MQEERNKLGCWEWDSVAPSSPLQYSKAEQHSRLVSLVQIVKLASALNIYKVQKEQPLRLLSVLWRICLVNVQIQGSLKQQNGYEGNYQVVASPLHGKEHACIAAC